MLLKDRAETKGFADEGYSEQLHGDMVLPTFKPVLPEDACQNWYLLDGATSISSMIPTVLIPDTVFTKLAYTLKHGLPVVHRHSVVSTLAPGETMAADIGTGSYWDIDLQLLNDYIVHSPQPTPFTNDQDPEPVAGVECGGGGQAPAEVTLVWPTLAYQKFALNMWFHPFNRS
ncbi:hypothetical protein Q9L58_005615 [Maublancomyces gigas]|uniref:Uncharacterized protein n=1 Tax=Discina gigas TaxID=1032678 RepID=A0ABR3GHJ2_9PEZI